MGENKVIIVYGYSLGLVLIGLAVSTSVHCHWAFHLVASWSWSGLGQEGPSLSSCSSAALFLHVFFQTLSQFSPPLTPNTALPLYLTTCIVSGTIKRKIILNSEIINMMKLYYIKFLLFIKDYSIFWLFCLLFLVWTNIVGTFSQTDIIAFPVPTL